MRERESKRLIKDFIKILQQLYLCRGWMQKGKKKIIAIVSNHIQEKMINYEHSHALKLEGKGN